ncbi:hypothetical protein [Pseudobacillus badius]|uniref:hypothetical protein n=1 Tax=Bacillus badius TaxID=1455 RepID=UPI003D339A87
MRNCLLVALMFFSFFISNMQVGAAEFDLKGYNEYQQYQLEHTQSFQEFSQQVKKDTDYSFSVMYNMAFQIFTIIFVGAVVVLAGAITLKNGQWMKWSSNTMVFTLITILIIRLVPILFLTVNVTSFTMLITAAIELLVHALFYFAVTMVLVSLFLKMLYRMFEHPKYFRWSRSLFNGSILVFILSLITPVIIQNL